jgi:hypothetical protein
VDLECEKKANGHSFIAMASVHNAGKLKFGAEKKGEKRKKAFLNNWTPCLELAANGPRQGQLE